MIKIVFLIYVLLTTCLFYIQHKCLMKQIDENEILLHNRKLYKMLVKIVINDLELVLDKETNKKEKEKILNEEIEFLKQVLKIENGEKDGVHK